MAHKPSVAIPMSSSSTLFQDDVDRQLELATTQLSSEKYQDGINTLTNAIKKEPMNAVGLLMRAQAYAITGKSVEMSEDIRVFSTLFPEWIKTQPTTRGWLKKYSKTQGKKLYFYLKGRVIMWFTSERDDTIEKGAYLHDFSVIPDSTKKGRFNITISNASAFVLEAESDADKGVWMTALATVLETPKITPFILQGREKTTFSDWLWKAGGKNTNASFKKRYCTIKGNMFYYYEHQTDTIPKGFWDLKGCELGRIKEPEGSSRFRWKVTLKEDNQNSKKRMEERVLHVETPEKREKWLIVFCDSAKVSLNVVDKRSIPKATTLTSNSSKTEPTPPATKSPLKPGKDKKNRESVNLGGIVDVSSIENPISYIPLDHSVIQEISELVSPRPSTCCFFDQKMYDARDIEKERNAEAIKSGRMLGFDEEWDEGEKDWLSGEEDEEDTECIIS